ncbi:MAG: aspartate--ammonia ligase [Bacteroidota bacterium]|nr:aspartate--ammonia ligase [Bacteroidota bacterium]
MSYLILPPNYKASISLKQTEQAIKLLKDFFQQSLAAELRLRRVTAPLFVLAGKGINDNLSGKERPVNFAIKDMQDAHAEIVHSLAKWKRLTLAEYCMEENYGIYTDMNAIRADEELGNMHSLYVDQWDWEMCINDKDRTIHFLKSVVRRIYSALRQTEFILYEQYPNLPPVLPETITFIHSEELLKKYPGMSPKERENAFAKKHKAIFVFGIGGKLSDGSKHDERAPDYDDWTTPNEDGYLGLNGDLIVWNDVLDCSLELSSMGIRVDRKALLKQLEICGCEDRKELYFHQKLLNNDLPLSIGGGIGQSRLCMFLLKKAHIGEIQSSIWPEDMRISCQENGIILI